MGLLFSNTLIAQPKTRKIPFLPYTGMPTTATSSGSGVSNAQYETVYFKKGSAALRADQKKN